MQFKKNILATTLLSIITLSGCGSDSTTDETSKVETPATPVTPATPSALIEKIKSVPFKYSDNEDFCSLNAKVVKTDNFDVSVKSSNVSDKTLELGAQEIQSAFNDLIKVTKLNPANDLNITDENHWKVCIQAGALETFKLNKKKTKIIFSPTNEKTDDSYMYTKHMMYHVMQNKLANGDENLLPSWFYEATADYFAGRASHLVSSDMMSDFFDGNPWSTPTYFDSRENINKFNDYHNVAYTMLSAFKMHELTPEAINQAYAVYAASLRDGYYSSEAFNNTLADSLTDNYNLSYGFFVAENQTVRWLKSMKKEGTASINNLNINTLYFINAGQVNNKIDANINSSTGNTFNYLSLNFDNYSVTNAYGFDKEETGIKTIYGPVVVPVENGILKNVDFSNAPVESSVPVVLGAHLKIDTILLKDSNGKDVQGFKNNIDIIDNSILLTKKIPYNGTLFVYGINKTASNSDSVTTYETTVDVVDGLINSEINFTNAIRKDEQA